MPRDYRDSEHYYIHPDPPRGAWEWTMEIVALILLTIPGAALALAAWFLPL